jgi:protein SCO1/2
MATKSIGKPSIGGPLNLLDTESRPFTEANLLGKWTLIYFGFTHCPDICPEELDKMGQAVELCESFKGGDEVMPLFVSVDPARDSVEQVRKYIKGKRWGNKTEIRLSP